MLPRLACPKGTARGGRGGGAKLFTVTSKIFLNRFFEIIIWCSLENKYETQPKEALPAVNILFYSLSVSGPPRSAALGDGSVKQCHNNNETDR